MPVFHPDEIRVFDRAGNPLGTLTGWSVEQPRSFRFTEVEDFTFSIPREDQTTGTVYLDSFTCNTLLREDNLIYVANETYGMRGWGGIIGVPKYGGRKVVVPCRGLFDLYSRLETLLIEQDDGLVSDIAQRLVSAANAKQGAHGDLVLGFQSDETPGAERQNFGHFAYEGDILAGLQQLASATNSECFVHARIRTDGTLTAVLRWAGRYLIDNTDIVIMDGEGGSLMPGNEITFTSDDAVNHVRLRGAATQMDQYLDYDSVRNVLNDITPEAEVTLDPAGDYHRRREDLNLQVDFGYSTVTQAALAAQVQEKYLGFFKAFLYAYHQTYGKPYLDGYDWEGPDGRNDKRLTAHYGRAYSRLAFIGHRTVILGSTDDDDETVIEAQIDDWLFLKTISPVQTCVGIAADFAHPGSVFLADAATNAVYSLDDDLVTVTQFLTLTGGGTIASVASDPAMATTIWVLRVAGSTATVESYDTNDGNLISSWSKTLSGANDIAVDAGNGVLWMVATSTGTVQALDLNSGAALSGDFNSFASGFSSPKGISVTGGVAYITDGSGNIRMLFDDDGNFAGSKATGVATNGIFADPDEGRIWLPLSSGQVSIYQAHVAVAADGGAGIVEGAPGFEAISAGQFVHAVFNTDTAATPHTTKKLLICYSRGKYVTRVVPGPIGQPDVLQRDWTTGDQKVAWIARSKLHWTPNEQVIQGEESRVDEWSPKDDGYGYFASFNLKNKRGQIVHVTKGWFIRDWDVPDSEFEVDPPEWTEGVNYLNDYLARVNGRRSIQTLKVINVGNLFSKIVLGGLYTVRITLEGPVPGGFGDNTFRVLSYTPDERQGYMEVIGEWM